jgi:hypothetical protein
MAKKTPEGYIKSKCLEYLRLRHIYAWNNPSGAVMVRPGQFMRFGKKGSSDIIGCLPGGRFLAIEIKAKRGRLSDEQGQFLERIRGLGGIAIVARGFRDIDETLRRGGYVDDGPLFSAQEIQS